MIQFLLAAALADPCGMVPPAWVGPGEGIVRTGEQETYVFFDKGIETIAIRPGYSGNVSEFGMLVPIPTAPALRKISDETFAHLAAAVNPPAVQVHFYDNRPRPRRSGMPSSAASKKSESRDDGGPSDRVVVINQEAMGMYEVAVLEAGGPKALERWMTEKNYKYPEGMDDVVLDYVRQGWLFVAVKTRVNSAAGVDPRPGMRSVQPSLPQGTAFTGQVQGMAFRFRVDSPVVPMRLSTFNGEDTVNRVYMVSDRPVRVNDRPDALVKRQLDGRTLHGNLTGPLPVRYLNGTAEELPSSYQEQLAALRSPDPFVRVARDLLAGDALAVRTGELSLSHEKEEKELLNINEALNLRGSTLDSMIDTAMQVTREQALSKVVPDLRNYSLTLIEGDLGRSWLRANNVAFRGWTMPQGLNKPAAESAVVQWMSVPKVANDNGWWPY